MALRSLTNEVEESRPGSCSGGFSRSSRTARTPACLDVHRLLTLRSLGAILVGPADRRAHARTARRHEASVGLDRGSPSSVRGLGQSGYTCTCTCSSVLWAS